MKLGKYGFVFPNLLEWSRGIPSYDGISTPSQPTLYVQNTKFLFNLLK